MDPKNAIEIRNIVKTFKIEVEDPEKKGGILNRNPTKTIENKVLDGITLDIRKGDVLGVLGRNGSGKSTFLSMIARIMEPDSGTIECSGKVASILELGMGFHQDMSGRENIYLKGELYGFSRKEMDSKIDRIIEYSGISKYIDNPVRTYSSGMSGRLAFSIMMNVDSDIMLVDEILSVGDAAFMAKAKEHFKKLARSGKTVVFVSHSINDVADMCNRAVWIEDGKIIRDGNAKDVCAEYQNKMSSSPEIIADLAEAGVAESQYELAMMYRDGTNFGKSEELYEEWMKKAADQGHTLAQIEYADILLERGNEDDISEAMSLYQSAANKGNDDARVKIASFRKNTDDDDLHTEIKKIFLKMAEEGDPINQFRCADYLLKTAWTNEDRKEAFEWFLKSSENGYPNATHQVALMQRDGVGTTKNYEEMEKNLKKASDSGFLPSIILLADTYIQGRLIPKNEKGAFEQYLKGARLGNGKCQYQVAVMYRDGMGTEIDVDESEKWFERFSYSTTIWNNIWAADWAKMQDDSDSALIEKIYLRSAYGGNTIALSNILNTAIANNEFNEKKYDDLMNSLKFLAENGNIDAARRVGTYYYDGAGVKKDYSVAIKWYEMAALLGDQWSKNRLGEMYKDGKGTTPDMEKAMEWFAETSIFGNTVAIANILNIYSTEILEKDIFYEKNINFLKKLAMNGSVDAARRVGTYYYDGAGVKKDYSVAIKWYEMAALLGDQWSKNRLGEMYKDGKGTTPDMEKAIRWLIES